MPDPLLVSAAAEQITQGAGGPDNLQIALALVAIIGSLVGALVVLVRAMTRQSDKHVTAMVGVLTTSMTEFRDDLREGLQGVDHRLEKMSDSLTSMRDDMAITRANTDRLAYGDVTPTARPQTLREPGRPAVAREQISGPTRGPRRG